MWISCSCCCPPAGGGGGPKPEDFGHGVLARGRPCVTPRSPLSLGVKGVLLGDLDSDGEFAIDCVCKRNTVLLPHMSRFEFMLTFVTKAKGLCSSGVVCWKWTLGEVLAQVYGEGNPGGDAASRKHDERLQALCHALGVRLEEMGPLLRCHGHVTMAPRLILAWC